MLSADETEQLPSTVTIAGRTIKRRLQNGAWFTAVAFRSHRKFDWQPSKCSKVEIKNFFFQSPTNKTDTCVSFYDDIYHYCVIIIRIILRTFIEKINNLS